MLTNLLLLINILGSLGLFIYGMKIMSEGIQRAAGATLRSVLRSFTKNRFLGLLTGITTTAVLQSSSATTVMTVSFVNAGLLSLTESAGIMMGANIGTTITGWMSSLEFQGGIHQLSLPLLCIGLPLFFSSNDRYKFWGQFVIGFSLLFLGLNFLKESVPDVGQNLELLDWIKDLSSPGILTNILFVLIGALLTIVVQSSSAAMVLTMTMAMKGWITYEIAAALVLGENIGTTITAEIAALVGNLEAKRSARIHSLFNIIGVIWMIILLPYVLRLVSTINYELFNIKDPSQYKESISIGLAAFHTTFNVLNALLLVGFIPLLIKLAKWSVPEWLIKESQSKNYNLTYISKSSKTPELAIIELRKEIFQYVDIISRMSKFTIGFVNTRNRDLLYEQYARIIKYEGITDNIRDEIMAFITQLSKSELTAKTSANLNNLLIVTTELERLGDIYEEIAEALHIKNQKDIWFNPDQRRNINSLLTLTDTHIKSIISYLDAGGDQESEAQKLKSIKNEFSQETSALKENYFDFFSKDDINSHSMSFYNTIIASITSLHSHLNEISIAITRKG